MTQVLLFLRAPQAGLSKTRLIPALGREGAAALALAMAQDTVALVERCGLPLTLVVDGALDSPWLLEMAGRGHTLRSQVPGDLGERLIAAMPDAPAIALGGDAPTLPAELLLRAAAHEVDVSLGPAFDGGYTLLAWTRARPRLFQEIPWSSDAVLAETVSRAQGLTLQLLPFWYDVDTPADLNFLRQHLRVLPPDTAPATRALLRALG